MEASDWVNTVQRANTHVISNMAFFTSVNRHKETGRNGTWIRQSHAIKIEKYIIFIFLCAAKKKANKNCPCLLSSNKRRRAANNDKKNTTKNFVYATTTTNGEIYYYMFYVSLNVYI